MNKYLQDKIVAFLVICFIMMPSLSLAQGLSNSFNYEDYKLIKTISYDKVIFGEKLDTSDYGPGIVEHMSDCIARDLLLKSNIDEMPKEDNIKHGTWVVPSRDLGYNAHSGENYVINTWGDTIMSIAFQSLVYVRGAWFANLNNKVSTNSIRVLGYLNDEIIQVTDWFNDIDSGFSWFAMNLDNVNRIVIEAKPVINGAGWYAMDDLTYTPIIVSDPKQQIIRVIDFEDCFIDQNLNDSKYDGLIWETGTGSCYNDNSDKIWMPISDRYKNKPYNDVNLLATPTLINDFQGVVRGDADSWSYPPDSCGVAGPNHFVEVVNRNFAVYDKTTGEELINMYLRSFLPGSNGDPRVIYDQYSEHWFIIVCDFTTKIYLAVSISDDPTGDWFKCSFVVSEGSDTGRWPDYPTLGVDEVGIYTAMYMVGGDSMSIFALDKAPLIDTNPSIGDIYAFRDLPWEGSIQPVHTFDSSDGEYFVSCASSTSIRVRLLTNLLSNPILNELCLITIPYYSTAPDAPALGSTIPLDTVDYRLMNAVYRDDYIWTTHCINVDGRAGCRWYKIDTSNNILNDYGTIQDPVMYYFFPSIMVNGNGDAIMGFSGSNSNQYAAAYYTGRLASDPPGQMATPILLKEGEDTYNLIDSYGRNRWGDYSLCSFDPTKNTLWTIQEYAHEHVPENDTCLWGTWIGELTFNLPPNTPNITGPNCGAIGLEHEFSFISNDPENNDIFYYINWGDGQTQDWTGPFTSNVEQKFNHKYNELGLFEIKAKSKDTFNLESDWSEPFNIKISNPPNAPDINGPTSGKPGTSYDYTLNSVDPDNDTIRYIIDWGDGKSDTSDFYISGLDIIVSHIWNEKGTYIIKAKAQNSHGINSSESTKTVTIPRNRTAINSLFLIFLERFLIHQKLLNRIEQ